MTERRQPRQRGIVRWQAVDGMKVERSRELRQSMTGAEAVLWQQLRRLRPTGLVFRRQQVIHAFIVDFYCHKAGLVIEVDGPIHDVQPEYDAERDLILKQRGLRLLRIRNDEVFSNLTAVLNRIQQAAQPTSVPPSPIGEGAGG